MTTYPCSDTPPSGKSFASIVRAFFGDRSGAVRMRHVALPTEHGGWGFILEPIVLGLAIAPTYAGFLIGLAAFFGFLARQPLKTAMVDHLRGRIYPRTVVARRFFAFYAIAGVTSLAAAVALCGPRFMIAFAAVAPLGFLQLWFDARNESRSLLPELTGPVAIAAVTPAIALAGGLTIPLAATLWALLVLRSLPTILYVRGRLRLERGGDVAVAGITAAHTAAIIGALALHLTGHGSVLAIAALALLMLRAIVGMSPFRANISAKGLGFRELGFGALTIVLIAAGAWTGI